MLLYSLYLPKDLRNVSTGLKELLMGSKLALKRSRFLMTLRNNTTQFSWRHMHCRYRLQRAFDHHQHYLTYKSLSKSLELRIQPL